MNAVNTPSPTFGTGQYEKHRRLRTLFLTLNAPYQQSDKPLALANAEVINIFVEQ
jgi:hypothetical protein